MLTRSADGTHWSPATKVVAQAHHDYINTDVAARAGKVYVANSTRDLTDENGRYVQQQISISRDPDALYHQTVWGATLRVR